MKRNYVKKMLAVVLAGTMALGCIGCGSGSDGAAAENAKEESNQEESADTTEASEDESTDAAGEKVVTALVSDSLTPELADSISSGPDFRLYEMIYEPLIKYGKDGKIEPELAEKWEISEDGTRYTFYLRKDAKFSDGTDFNADSVIWNADRWLENDLQGLSAPLLEVNKIDDYTVEFVFESAAYACLTELTYPRPYRMLGESGLDENGEFTAMIGTGEWMIESYESEQEVVLVPNPYYYGEAPKVDKVILKQVGDGQSRCMAMQSGEADISIADIPTENLSVIENDPSLDIFEINGTLGFFLIENYENPVLQDVNVRQALNYAVDRQNMVDSLLDGAGRPATGILTPETPYVTEENTKGYEYDVAKAQELLKKSGYEDTDGDGIVEKDGQPLNLRLSFQTEEFASWKTVCEYLQAEYAKAGIGIELVQLESAAYYDAIWDNRDYDLIIYRTYEDSWNPHGFIKGMFYQDEGAKAACWYDKELNESIADVLKTMDETEREKKWDKVFKMVDENAYTIPLYYPNIGYVYNTRLTGIEAAPTAYENVEWNMLDKTE